MVNQFKKIINKMDANLKEYNQKNDYEKEFVALKENLQEFNSIKELEYEIDILNFTIEKDELIPLYSMGNSCYPNIKDFDENHKNYLKYRFENTPNDILKNLYLITILHLNLNHEEIRSFIDKSIMIINNHLTNRKDIELTSDLIFTTFDKGMSLNYKKDEIKEIIIKYVKSDFNDKYSIKDLIELMLSKKKVYKKEDFEEIDDICWNYANESESMTHIEFLELGLKISQKLQKDIKKWYNRFGEAYENFADNREDSKFIQNNYLSESLYYFKKADNPQKVKEISIKLKRIQNEYKPSLIPFSISLEEPYNEILNEIYEKMPLESNSFLEYLINSQNDILIPKLEKNDENYENLKQTAPLLAFIQQVNVDNNHNIIQKISNDEEKIKESNHMHYRFATIFQNLYLTELIIYSYNLKIFTHDNVLIYLSTCQKFLNIENNGKTLLYYFTPLLEEYFKQLELVLSYQKHNYVLFIDSIVSKIELLIRKLCEIYDIEMIKPQSEGTTSEKLLHDFFNDSNFKKILLEKDYDFLKYVLLKPGLNLRNKSAHAFDLEIYTFDNANLLLLCFFRLLKYFIIIDGDYFQELNLFEKQQPEESSNI